MEQKAVLDGDLVEVKTGTDARHEDAGTGRMPGYAAADKVSKTISIDISNPREGNQFRTVHSFVRMAGLVLIIAGFILMAGWWYLFEPLRGIFPGTRPMMPDTAIGFVLAGCFLWLTGGDKTRASTRRMAHLCALMVISGAAFVLLQYLVGLPAGGHPLLSPSGLGEAVAVRPPFLTALSFLLFGSAMLLLDWRTSRAFRPTELLAATGTLISLLALIGYSCSVRSFYEWTSLFGGRGMALETAVLFVVLGLGLFCVRPEHRLMTILASQTASGTMARRLMLAPVLIPLATGLLKSLGLRMGIYNVELASWMFAFLNIFLFTGAIWWSASLLYRAEMVQKIAEKALQTSNAELEQRVDRGTLELSSTEAKFRTLVEQSIVGIYAIQGGKLGYVNPKMSEILLFTVEELTSRPLIDFILEEDRPLVTENIRKRLEGGVHHIHYNLRMVRKDGSVIHVEAFGARSEYNGRPAVLGTLLDVTERKQAEYEVQRSQKRLRDLIDGLGPSIFVGLMTPQGILIEANRPALAAAGLKPEDVLGKPFEETYWWAYSREVQQQLREAITRAARGDASRYDVQVRATENHLIDVDFSLQPVRDQTGEVVFLVPSASVITERKRAEESLRLLGSAVEQSKESIVITDAKLDLPGPEIIFVNPAFTRLTGYTAEEALGKTPRILQGPRTDKTVLSRLRQNLERGEVFQGETINYRKDGTEFYLEWQIAPIRNGSEEITHFVAMQRDITGRKQTEAELEKTHMELVRASRQAGMAEVATGVLHNVGNVLNSVNVASSCLADSLRRSKAANLSKVVALLAEHTADLGAFLTSNPKGKQIPGYLSQLAGHLASEQASALKELAGLQKNIEHIKTIVTMQQGYAKMSGVTEKVQITDLIEDSLQMDTVFRSRHGVRVICEFAEVPPVVVDKQKVLQILVNLVCNARHACTDSGRPDKRLTLKIFNEDGRVKVAVSDNGVGIPPENLTRIFAHGFTTKKDGHGFGLHSSALAAKEMGGSLTVHSDGMGLGATFTLELPVRPEPDSASRGNVNSPDEA